MPEHLIRLRGGWLWLDPGSPDSAPDAGRRVTLPMTWPSAEAEAAVDAPRRHVRLVRTFGLPPFDADRETLSLRLCRAVGLVSARLNDLEMTLPPEIDSAIDVPLPDGHARRNRLILIVEPPAPGTSLGPWGEVALVISPRRFNDGSTPGGEELLGGLAPRA